MTAMRDDYADKPDNYYAHARTEIAALLPPHSARVLEIGCGEGATLAWLKATRRCDSTTGVELFAEAAERARARVDHVEQGDAASRLAALAARGPYDLVLCLDVLEHLVDPWALVASLTGLLRSGGVLVASVPNVRHYRVSLPLLLLGRWRYEADGVLDRTHLRFFTREGAQALLQGPQLVLQRCHGSRPPRGSGSWWLSLLSLGLLADLLAVQYLVAAERA